MRSSVLALACLAIGSVTLQPSPRADEPDGFVRITPRWTGVIARQEQGQAGEDPAGVETLTLQIQPIVPLADARLILSFPDAVTLRPSAPAGSSFHSLQSGSGTRRLALDLGSVDSVTTLAIEVETPPPDVGLATLAVQGRTMDGRSFSEEVGVGLLRPGRGGGVERDGAIEYPAAAAGKGR